MRAEGQAGDTLPPAPVVTNLAELVTLQAANHPDAPALVQPLPRRRSLSWAELDARVTAVASGLAGHGLVAGHRVALCGGNSIEFVVSYLAALRAGFVCVPVNPESTERQLHAILVDSAARLLLAADPDRPGTRSAGVATVPLTEDGLAGLAAEGSGSAPSPVDRESLAVLLYTAGTSGDPKAAMLSHRALLSHLEHFHGYGVVDHQSVVLAVLPLFHVFGLNAVLGACLSEGATCVLTDGADQLLSVVPDEQVTNLPLAPSLLSALLESDGAAAALAGVRTVVSGAAPLLPELAAAVTARTGLRVEQGYGLTEAAPGVTFTLGSERSGPGHVGKPLPGVEVRIGSGLDQGEPAEIWIRGDNLFSGYWPDGHDAPDADGWFATGDIGYLDVGELFLVDRARELIGVHGFHVFPAEVEKVILEVPGVEEVAVIGRPGQGAGEQVVAFVAGSGLTVESVREHCLARLARFKRPTEIHLVPALPRGTTGKIRKGALRALLDHDQEATP